MKHWMLLGACLAGGLLSAPLMSQTATPIPADPPPPPLIPVSEPAPTTVEKKTTATKPPAKSPAKPVKPAARPTAAANRPATNLKPGSAVATEKNANVRGQATINSEIVTQLKRGDIVTVLDVVTLKNHSANEPGEWAKISLPAGSVVWTHASFVDAKTKAVKPNRLNLRSGPGENYSILGRINKGTVLHELERKGDWIKVEAPTNAYAFAWARLFSQEPALLAAALAKPATRTTTTTTTTTTTAVVQERPVETVAVTTPTVVAPAGSLTPPPPTPVPDPVPTPAAPVTTATTPPVTAPEPPPSAPASAPVPVPAGELEPLVKRIVTREGMVRGSASIQAPTYFVLRSLDNNRTINYLHSIDTNIVLRAFQHQRVIVVGEEVLDERWPNTPVIDVESIEAVP